MAEIVDLRGREREPTRAPVLSDPSGRRARLLARAGRVAAAVLMLWIAGLALAGLGVLPAGDVPLGHAIAGSTPPALRAIPAPINPSADDLKPAVPAAAARTSAPVRVASRGAGASRSSTGHQRGPTAGGRHRLAGAGHHRGPGASSGGSSGTGTVPITNPTSPTAAGTATGAPGSHRAGTTTAPGQSTKQSMPGHARTTAPGNSPAAPGQVKQTTTTTTTATTTSAPGQSGSAPGQTVTHGSTGHGHNG
jgi:hypothetical protein